MNDEKPKSTPPVIRARARELRHKLTPAELTLWNALRGRQLNGLKFRRQHPIGPFIADYYCAEQRLVIEVDGDIHKETIEEDLARTRQMADYGYRLIRFHNEEIENDLPRVLSQILLTCTTPPKGTPSP